MAVVQRALFLVLFVAFFLFLHGSAHRPDPNASKKNKRTVVVKTNTTVVVNANGKQHVVKHNHKQHVVVKHNGGKGKGKRNNNNKRKHWVKPKQQPKVHQPPQVQAEIKPALPNENKPTVVIVTERPKPPNYKPTSRDPDPKHPYEGLVPVPNSVKFKVEIPNIPPPTAEQEAADEQMIKQQANPQTMEKNFETKFKGSWKLHSPDAKVSAMQMQLMPNGKAMFSDTIAFGPSNMTFPPPHPQNCRQRVAKAANDKRPPVPEDPDCYAHAVEYDTETAAVKPIMVVLDQWCSSGGLTPKGELMSSGGYEEGYRAVRLLDSCPTCNTFREKANAFLSDRWYSTQITLEDGNFVIFGGRKGWSYEFFPSDTIEFAPRLIDLPFLRETDIYGAEYNLYPFVYLLPEGNIYLFANNRSVLLETNTGKIIREYPVLPGGGRNYPGSGMSVLFPLDLRKGPNVECEVLICGGAVHESWLIADQQKKFLDALQDCARMIITKPDAKWEMEMMPTRRVMGDMLILPNLEILLVNGAKKGLSGWGNADDPNMVPLMYSYKKNNGQRFTELQQNYIPRMYHSSSALLPNGKVMISGSNTNPSYNTTKEARFGTETSVEMFYPPYLDPKLQPYKPQVDEAGTDKMLKYGQQFKIKAKLVKEIGVSNTNVEITMYSPPFTSHGYSMNQRMLVLPIVDIKDDFITVTAPANGRLAPKGYHIMWVVHRGVPSNGFWVQIA